MMQVEIVTFENQDGERLILKTEVVNLEPGSVDAVQVGEWEGMDIINIGPVALEVVSSGAEALAKMIGDARGFPCPVLPMPEKVPGLPEGDPGPSLEFSEPTTAAEIKVLEEKADGKEGEITLE